MVDGSVSIVEPAPMSVILDGKEHRVGLFERTKTGGYVITYSDADTGAPMVRTFSQNDPAIKFHAPETIVRKLGKEYTEIIPVNDQAFLGDRTYRNAWVITASELVVDMPKARELHRGYMRTARESRLAQLDIDYLRGMEAVVASGFVREAPEQASLADIAAQKQTLRDIPQMPEIEAAETPEDLKKVWPPELGPNPTLNQAS